MQSFSDFTDRLIELPDDEIEQLDEINLKRAVGPAFRISKIKTSASEITECKIYRRG